MSDPAHPHLRIVDGHLVDTRIYSIDRFYDGRTGKRVTDAQWDAEQAILDHHEKEDRT